MAAFDQGNARDHLALALARIADADDPGFAEPIADDAAVAAGGDIGPRVTARFQHVDAAVHRIALGDAAQIDAHAFLRELHGLILGVEQHVTIVDRGQGLVDLRLVRTDVLAEIVHVADAGIGDVEGASVMTEYSLAVTSRSNNSLLICMGPSAALALTCETSLVGL